MYCPRCGDEMELVLGVYRCQRGEMELSYLTAEELIECFVARRRSPRSRPMPRQVDGEWFCPGCGVELINHQNSLRCPACQRCINEFVRQLVEFHPHRDERGMWPWH